MKLDLYRAMGFTPQERAFIQETFADKKGWRSLGHVCVAAPPGTEMDEIGFEIRLCDDKFMDSKFPHVHLEGLSVCDMGATPKQIYLRRSNWDSVPPASGYKTLAAYRQYLVNHETGHAIELRDHEDCKGSGLPAPVMMQQTKGTGECYPYPWFQLTEAAASAADEPETEQGSDR